MSTQDIDSMIQRLAAVSPMPADDDPALTEERLKEYQELQEASERLIDESPIQESARLIPHLITSFGYGDGYEVYWSTIHLLEKFPRTVREPFLREGLLNGPRGARKWCAFMLGAYRNPENLSFMVRASNDPESEVRIEALQAIGMLGEPSGIPALKSHLGDPVKDVRDIAREMLTKLRKKS